jgi:radical SAM enzyme (TIGR01210 family)
VQRNTYVNYLWNRWQYRPAWLFSIVEILKESKKMTKNLRLKCDIVGGGNIRGVHNCKLCDRKFLDAIAEFSISQNLNVFDGLDCECKEKWLDQLDIEDLGFGSLVNIYG